LFTQYMHVIFLEKKELMAMSTTTGIMTFMSL